MKHKFLLITGTIIIVLLIIIFILKNNNNNKDYLIDITYDEYLEKVNNKDTFVLYVKQTNCSHCISFTPKFKELLSEYKVTAYSLNLTNMTEEEYNSFDNDLNVSGTPTIMFFEKGVELGTFSRIVGEKSNEYIINKLKLYDYIKQN